MNDMTRIPFQCAVLKLDRCSLTFGTGDCTATGTPCYNTYRTCKDKANYSRTTKDHEFTSVDAPLPYHRGERPYLESAKVYPTEIKEKLPTSGRLSLTLIDELDDDVGIDPYRGDREKATTGTYWKKLLRRNPYLPGRVVEYYEGEMTPATTPSPITQTTDTDAEWDAGTHDGTIADGDALELRPVQGSGTVGDPYQIATLNDLRWFSETTAVWGSGNYFIVTADFDAADTKNWNGGEGFSPIGKYSSPSFQGNFDGQRHKISNLYINRPTETRVGLFGFCSSATITDVILVNPDITGSSSVAGIAGQPNSSTITRPQVSGGTITGGKYTGAIGGYCYNTTVTDYCCTADVSTSGWSGTAFGYVSSGATISNGYSRGDILNNTLSRGGGHIGLTAHDTTTLTNCYSTSSVSSGTTHGFVANNYGGPAFSACFFDVDASNQESDAEAFATSTADMKTQATFTGIDAALTVSLTTAGTGYTAEDELTLTGGDDNCTVTVLTVGGSGEILTITLHNGGSGMATADYAVTGGTGSGAEITVDSLSNFDFVDTWAIDPEINDGYPYLQNNPPVDADIDPVSDTWTSAALSLSSLITARSSLIEWSATTPEGTSVTIEAAVSTSGVTAPESGWSACTSGEAIPGITAGDRLVGYYLWLRATLTSDDYATTPSVTSLEVTVTGAGEPGFAGHTVVDSREVFVGVIDSVSYGDGGRVTIECVDLLTDLAKIDVPAKTELELASAIGSGDTSMTVTDATLITSGQHYVRVNDEIIYYTSKNDTSGVLSGLSRGQFSTTAAAHDEGDRVQPCRYYGWDNPFTILHDEMLQTDGGVASAHLNSSSFTDCADVPGDELDVMAIITEPTKLSELVYGLVDLFDCRIWVAEDLKITICRNLPNRGGRTYTELSDDVEILDSGDWKLDPESRTSRVVLYWGRRTGIADPDDETSYAAITAAVDADTESDNAWGEAAERVILSPWIHRGHHTEEDLDDFLEALTLRRVAISRDARHTLRVTVSAVDDGDIKTGSYVRLATDEWVDEEGYPIADARYQVIRRDPRGDDRIILTLEQQAEHRLGIIAPDDDFPDEWEDATPDQREYGAICDDNGDMPDGSPGYIIF